MTCPLSYLMPILLATLIGGACTQSAREALDACARSPTAATWNGDCADACRLVVGDKSMEPDELRTICVYDREPSASASYVSSDCANACTSWAAIDPLGAIDVYLDAKLSDKRSASLLDGIAYSPPYVRVLIERARGTDQWALVMAKAKDLGPAAPWFRDEVERALERPRDCGTALDHLWTLDLEAAARWSAEALTRPARRGDTCSVDDLRRAVDARCVDLVARPEVRTLLTAFAPSFRAEREGFAVATRSELLCASLIEAGTPTHGP